MVFILFSLRLIRLSSYNLNYLIGCGAVIGYMGIYFLIIPTTDPRVVAALCTVGIHYWSSQSESLVISFEVIKLHFVTWYNAFGDRFCTSRKGGTTGGGWVLSEQHIAVEKALFSAGCSISLRFCTNECRNAPPFFHLGCNYFTMPDYIKHSLIMIAFSYNKNRAEFASSGSYSSGKWSCIWWYL